MFESSPQSCSTCAMCFNSDGISLAANALEMSDVGPFVIVHAQIISVVP